MFTLIRLRLPIAVIVAVVFAVLVAFAAFSSTADASHSWGGYHWARTSNPFTLQLGDNVDDTKWLGYLKTTSIDWSKSAVLDTNIVAGLSKGNCQPTSGRVEVCNKSYGWNGWLGLAQIWLSGKHITQGVTKVNDTYFDDQKWYGGKYDTPAWRNSVMCQEVGHTLGLGHNDEDFDTVNGTCMDYANDPTNNQHPNAHDYQQLEDIYRHLDTTTTVGSTSAASKLLPSEANRGDFNTRAEWGRKVWESSDKKQEVWERGFGNQAKMVTFVKKP